MDMEEMTLDDLLASNRRKVDLEFATEDLYKMLQLDTRRERVILLDFNELDAEFGEDDLADIEVEVTLQQDVETADIAGVVGIDGDGLEHAVQILLDIDGHLTI